MDVNDKLTNAARAGARPFPRYVDLPSEKRELLQRMVLSDSDTRIAAADLWLKSLEAGTLEDMLNAAGTSGASDTPLNGSGMHGHAGSGLGGASGGKNGTRRPGDDRSGIDD